MPFFSELVNETFRGKVAWAISQKFQLKSQLKACLAVAAIVIFK